MAALLVLSLFPVARHGDTLPKQLEDAGRRQVSELERQCDPMNIGNYVIGVSERSQHRCNFK